MRPPPPELFCCCVRLEDLPETRRPELAVVGRSNVGKSSFINVLLGRRLARISQTPGKTQSINLYHSGEGFLLADLPGYGFAKVGKKAQSTWAHLIEGYLSKRKTLRGVVLLLDARHPPSPLDITMQQWLHHYRIPILYVAMKADQIPRGRRSAMQRMLQDGLSLTASATIFPFSAKSGEGKEALFRAIRTWIPSERKEPN